MIARKLKIAALAVAVYVAAFGCKELQAVKDPTQTIVTPLADVKSEHKAARDDLDTAKKLTTQPEVKTAVISADGHIVNADKATDTATAAAIAEGKQSVSYQLLIAKLQALVYKLQHQFWSPMQIRLFWWILGGAILFGVFESFTVGLPDLSLVEHLFQIVKTFGLHVAIMTGHGMAAVLRWIGGKIAQLWEWLHPSNPATKLTVITVPPASAGATTAAPPSANKDPA